MNLPSYIKFNKSLLTIDIKSSRLNDYSLVKLSKGLGENDSLENINLTDNNLEFEGLTKFGQYTYKNNIINEIQLLNNKILSEQQSILKSCNSHLRFSN